MKKRSLVILVILTLTAIIISTLSSATPAAGSDELKRELLEDILSVDKPDLFDDYDELYLAKALTQAVIQGMEGKDVTRYTRDWVNNLLKIINDFEAMVTLSERHEPSNHTDAIELAEIHADAIKMADEINTSIDRLKNSGYDIPGKDLTYQLSKDALARFYRREGEFFENLSKNEKVTEAKIAYKNTSASSYGKGGIYTLSDASRMKFESLRDKWVYEREIKRALEYINESKTHLNNSKKPPSGLFGADFMEILKAKDSFKSAEEIYANHRDKELENVKELGDEIDGIYKDLMFKTLKNIALYLLILSLFTIILWSNFKRWSEELDDTRLGEELIV